MAAEQLLAQMRDDIERLKAAIVVASNAVTNDQAEIGRVAAVQTADQVEIRRISSELIDKIFPALDTIGEVSSK